MHERGGMQKRTSTVGKPSLSSTAGSMIRSQHLTDEPGAAVSSCLSIFITAYPHRIQSDVEGTVSDRYKISFTPARMLIYTQEKLQLPVKSVSL